MLTRRTMLVAAGAAPAAAPQVARAQGQPPVPPTIDELMREPAVHDAAI